MPSDNLGSRILVNGPSGSGKSTLAKQLGAKLGLPHVELDAIFHAYPKWRDLSTEEFRARVTEVLATHGDGWVTDGNYTPVRDLLLAEATTLIALQLPFRTVYPRLVRRTLSRTFTGEELWNGNRETWGNTLGRQSMLWWGVRTWRPYKRKIAGYLRELPPHIRPIILRSPREVRALLESAEREEAAVTA